MGSIFIKLYDTFYSKTEHDIVLLGLDSTGKKTILHQIQAKNVNLIADYFEYKNLKFRVFNTSFNTTNKTKLLLQLYFKLCCKNTKAVIYVVDSADSERLSLAKENLHEVLKEKLFKECPILIFGNKQDKASTSKKELIEELGLKELTGRNWFFQGCSAITKDGLLEGMEWLSKTLQRIK